MYYAHNQTSPLPDAKIVNEKLAKAKEDFASVSGIAHNTAPTTDNTDRPTDTFIQILQPLRVFNTLATWIADVRVHPYFVRD